MRKITTKIVFRIPSGMYCNLEVDQRQYCRFCTKTRNRYICVLHNIPLMHNGELMLKDKACVKMDNKHGIEEPPQPKAADPKLLKKATLMEYKKLYKLFVSQGYPHEIADKVAEQQVLGEEVRL